MNHLVLYCSRTKEFKREAKKYQTFHNVPDENMFDFRARWRSNKRWDVTKKLLSISERTEDTDDFVFSAITIFCHGWKNRTELGFVSDDIQLFGHLLGNMLKPGGTVVLYSCKNGVPNGFAQKLSENLLFHDCKVFSHTTSGHTTMNPDVAIFEGGEDITPHFIEKSFSPVNYKRLRQRLKRSNFRFELPFMPQDVLYERVAF